MVGDEHQPIDDVLKFNMIPLTSSNILNQLNNDFINFGLEAFDEINIESLLLP